MAGRVTMADVAAAAGVSAKTVSNVLGDRGGYSPETGARVLAAVAELGYRLNADARALRSRRSGVIALALPTLRQPMYAALAQAVLTEAGQVPVVLELTRGEARLEEDVLRGRLAQEADGVLYVPRALTPEALGADSRRTRPVVLVGGRPSDLTDQVVVPVEEQVALVAAHLGATGRRRPAVIGAARDPVDWTARCVARLREQGWYLPEELVATPVTGADSLRAGVEATLRLLRSSLPFDALVCHNDAQAAGALGVLRRHGARVPEDVAVVGRGDTELAAFASPALTSVAPGFAAVAREAVALLLSRVERPGAPMRQAVVSPTLAVRASSAKSGTS